MTDSATPHIPDLSVIVPVWNEVEGLDTTIREIRAELEGGAFSYEVIFVDDGSTDGSQDKMRSFVAAYPNVKLIALWRNFGQQQALLAGMAHSCGRVVIAYDSDLQFAPKCLPRLTEEILKGYDIVSGIRQNRKDGFFSNRLPSSIGRRLVNNALHLKITDIGSVKAFSRKLVDGILRQPGRVPVVYAEAFSLTHNYTEIPVEHQPRRIGTSKWSILKRMETYFDIYVAYAKRPFSAMLLTGATSLLLSVLLGIGIIGYRMTTNAHFSGTIIFFDVFLFFFGVHFLALSIVGEFVVRIYRHREMTLDTSVGNIFTHEDARCAPPARDAIQD